MDTGLVELAGGEELMGAGEGGRSCGVSVQIHMGGEIKMVILMAVISMI